MLISILKKESYFLSQPHQPFFLAGVLWAIAGMLVFTFAYHGVVTLSVNSTFFHAYSMIFMVFTPFFSGFVFTTFPRFCQSDLVEQKRYTEIFYLSQFGSLLFVTGALTHLYILTFGIFILLLSNLMIVWQLQKIYTNGYTSKNSSDTFWILSGFYVGLFVHLLFFLEISLLLFDVHVAYFFAPATIGFWNYLIFVAFAVAQRMVPFFSHVMMEKVKHFSATVFVGLFLKTVFIISMLKLFEAVVDIALALYIFLEFRRWDLKTAHTEAILWVLHLALYWIPVSLFLGAISQFVTIFIEKPLSFFDLHLMAIGFLTTILIGFGTRVTLGHSGQVPHADLYTKNLFLFIQLIVVFRALYALFVQELWLFDLSAFSWIVLYSLWIRRFALVLTQGKKIS